MLEEDRQYYGAALTDGQLVHGLECRAVQQFEIGCVFKGDACERFSSRRADLGCHSLGAVGRYLRRLADEVDVTVGAAVQVARKLLLCRRALHDGGVTQATDHDLVLEVDPEGIQVDAQILDGLEHQTQCVGLRFLRGEVRIAAGDGRELEAAGRNVGIAKNCPCA